jgi:DNA polymerase-3 subunit gamma/tau
VKFLFATTDPKKLPITVLSRCLQFNLKNLSPEQIVHYLGQVLGQEEIEFEESALWQLGHAADGSMRDALSLTDQAISFGGNAVKEDAVASMLGSIDRSAVFELLDYVASGNGASLLQRVAELADFAPDFAALLDDMLSVLHRVAIAHAVPDAVDNAQGDRELILAAAQAVSAEHVQLLYQIALIGQRDMPLAPTPRTGFEMVMLRMMSFSPGGGDTATESAQTPVATENSSQATSGQRAGNGRSSSPIAELLSAINGNADAPGEPASVQAKPADVAEAAPVESTETAPEEQIEAAAETGTETETETEADTAAVSLEAPAAETVLESVDPLDRAAAPDVEEAAGSVAAPDTTAATSASKSEAPALLPENWPDILAVLKLSGVTLTLASNCQLAAASDSACVLKLAEHHASLWNSAHEERIALAISELYQAEIRITIEVGDTDVETPAQRTERQRAENQAKAVAEIESDDHVRQLIETFNGTLDPDSIAPLKRAGSGE